MVKIYLNKFIIFFITVIPLLSGTGLILQAPDHTKFVFGLFGTSLILLIWFLTNKDIYIQKNDLYKPILFFLLWCSLSLVWAGSKYFAILQIAQFLSYGCIFFIVVNMLYKTRDQFTLLRYILVSLSIVSIIGLMQVYFENNEFINSLFVQTAKPASTFGNKNMASHFLVITIPLAIALLISAKKKKDIIIYGSVVILSLTFLIETTARQAYLAIAVELVILVVFFILDYFKNNKKSLLATTTLKINKVVTFTLILIFLFLTSNFSIKDWSSNNIHKSKTTTYLDIAKMQDSGRLAVWENTLKMIKDKPIVGFGAAQWGQYYNLYYNSSVLDRNHNHKNKFVNAHNDYLEMLVNFGLIGFAILIWLLLLSVRKIYKILNDPENMNRVIVLGLSLGLIGFLVVAFFSFPVQLYIPGFFVMIYLGLIYRFD